MSSVPSSFASICTFPCVQEIVGLILSLSVHHPESTLYIVSDTKSKEYIENVMTPKPRIKLVWETLLDKYNGKNRRQMEREGTITDFFLEKTRSIELALMEQPDVMFLDGDQLVVSRIQEIDKTKQLGVSPHFMPKGITDRYGYYNAGMLWTREKSLPARWRELGKTSRYVDQACVEDLAKEYGHFIFGPEYNIQSYRFTQGLVPMRNYMASFKAQNNKLLFAGKEVRTFHTHFRRGDSMTKINQFIQGMLIRSKKYRESAIIDRMLNESWVIQIPRQPQSHSHFNHLNDSFRMYPRMWKEQNKDVDYVVTNRANCWLGNSVMLYDRPTLDWMHPEGQLAAGIMVGNCGEGDIQEVIKRYGNNVKPWIFWPRDIGVYMRVRQVLPYEQRKTNVVFVGNYENSVQQKYRMGQDWSRYVDDFNLTVGKKHKFTKEEYVRRLGGSKYGLCLRGYGRKCHREVELMGVGTVPIVTPEVNISSYVDPPKENIHYIYVSKPEEISEKLKGITETKWKQMSEACVEWFERSKRWSHTVEGVLFK